MGLDWVISLKSMFLLTCLVFCLSMFSICYCLPVFSCPTSSDSQEFPFAVTLNFSSSLRPFSLLQLVTSHFLIFSIDYLISQASPSDACAGVRRVPPGFFNSGLSCDEQGCSRLAGGGEIVRSMCHVSTDVRI